jgi:hypothetical protein
MFYEFLRGCHSRPSTLAELAVGDKFIVFPDDGDDHGHGGFRGGGRLWVKIEPFHPGKHFAESARTTAREYDRPDMMTQWPLTIPVIRVHFEDKVAPAVEAPKAVATATLVAGTRFKVIEARSCETLESRLHKWLDEEATHRAANLAHVSLPTPSCVSFHVTEESLQVASLTQDAINRQPGKLPEYCAETFTGVRYTCVMQYAHY